MPADVRIQAVLSGAGGVTSTALDVGVLAALVEAGCPVAPAALCGASAGALLAFWFNRRFVFEDRTPLRWQQAVCFTAVALIGAVVMAVAMHLTASVLGIPYLLAKALCAVTVFALWSLPAQRRFVFPPAAAAPSFGDALSRSL
jgi:putative flippase GtrA